MRIVVTGGSGRLGRTLVTGLADAGHELISVDREPIAHLDRAGITQFSLDLTDADATASALAGTRADAVIHLAAIAVPFSAPEDVILRTNAALAQSVLSAEPCVQASAAWWQRRARR